MCAGHLFSKGSGFSPMTFNLRYLKKRTVGQGFAMQNPIPIPVSVAWPPTPGLLAPTGVAPEGGIARGRGA